MKCVLHILSVALLLLTPVIAKAQHELKSEESQTEHAVELRQAIGFSYDLPKNFDISLNEEVRSVVYDNMRAPSVYFSKSYTSLELGYKPLKIQSLNTGYTYGLKFSAGYTLRLLATKELTNPKKCLQHRPYLTMTGSVDFGNFKLSLRERYQVDIRLDSVSVVDKFDPTVEVFEKNPYKMELRSRLRLDYAIPGKPLKPYVYVEVTNTLNEPSCPWLGSNGEPLYGGQYLNSVRTALGLKWRIDAHNSLNFMYLFSYGKDRDINITRTMQHVEITNVTTYRHCIMVAYDLGY